MKGLDKFEIVFVESHIKVTCSVCHYIFDEFPASEDLIFSCPKCNRFFKLMIAVKVLTQEEIDAHLRMGDNTKANRITFKDL